MEFDVHVQPEIFKGSVPPQIKDADIVFIDPEALFYKTVLETINRDKPGRTIKRIHPHIDAILLSERGQSILGSTP
jgi:hypothetical protein